MVNVKRRFEQITTLIHFRSAEMKSKLSKTDGNLRVTSFHLLTSSPFKRRLPGGGNPQGRPGVPRVVPRVVGRLGPKRLEVRLVGGATGVGESDVKLDESSTTRQTLAQAGLAC